MKTMVFILVVLVGYIAFIKPDTSSALAAEGFSSAYRSNEQDKIVAQLIALDDPTVNKFIDEWVSFAPQPTSAQLSELRVIALNISKDKSVAESYTTEWHQKNSLCGNKQISGGVKSACTPGLN